MSHKIMVVDDSPLLRQILLFTLTAAGYQVLEAVDGLDALRKLTGENVDLLIADINMPNLDGMELLREMRRSKKDIPVFLLTSESDPDLQAKGLAAGAAACLVKPCHPEQLLGKVKAVLNRD